MNKKISLNMNQLKLIAMMLMLIDHFAYMMIELGVGASGNWYLIDRIMRGMGRAAFPIFCFTIVEGFQRTKDAGAYLKRLLLFALISEIPFDLAFRRSLVDFSFQNVFWTLAFGLFAMMLYENREISPWKRMFGLLVCFWVPQMVHTDYSMYGVLTMFLMYLFRKEPIKAGLAGYIVLLLQNPGEKWAIFGFLLILLYNGRRGKGNKYIYYLFYPAHLLLLVFLKPYIVSFLSGVFAATMVI